MVNKVILVGNVGMDPEIRTLENGAKVARIRLATTERLFDRQANESKDHTEWHTITLWRGLADVVDKYVRKGSQLYIEGRLRTREWTGQDNVKRYSTEILADVMNMLGRRSDASMGSTPTPPPINGGGYSAPNQTVTNPYGTAPQAQPVQQEAPKTTIPQDDPDDLPF